MTTPYPRERRHLHPNIHRFARTLRRDLWAAFSSIQQRNFSGRQNCLDSDLQALQGLRDHPTILFRKADKNLGTVLISRSKYAEVCRIELDEMRLEQLSRREMIWDIKEAQAEIRKLFNEEMATLEFKERFWDCCMEASFEFLKNIPVFYCLIKIHKPTLRGRPIVAASNLPFSILPGYFGWRMNFLIQQHEWLRTHLVKDSRQLVFEEEGCVFHQQRSVGMVFSLMLSSFIRLFLLIVFILNL